MTVNRVEAVVTPVARLVKHRVLTHGRGRGWNEGLLAGDSGCDPVRLTTMAFGSTISGGRAATTDR